MASKKTTPKLFMVTVMVEVPVLATSIKDAQQHVVGILKGDVATFDGAITTPTFMKTFPIELKKDLTDVLKLAGKGLGAFINETDAASRADAADVSTYEEAFATFNAAPKAKAKAKKASK